MPRLAILFANLGIVNRKYLKQFLNHNEVSVSGKIIERLDLSKNYDPKTIKINGEPLKYIEPLTIAYHKSKGEHQSECWDKLPETFSFRRPALRMTCPLPEEVSGLVVLTQFDDVFQRSVSVNFPIKRTYSIETEEEFTGRETEAINLLRGKIKERLENVFRQREIKVDKENAKKGILEIYDYKPDKISQMLIALRHEAKNIHRTHLGDFHIGSLKPGEWKEMSEEEVHLLLCKYNQKPKISKNKMKLENVDSDDEIEELEQWMVNASK
eukprot:gene8222-47_t